MKFVHVTDTHLGKSEAKLEEREKDFYSAFKQVIDFAIEKKVDFVIHTGDIFDKARPAVRTLVFAVEQLLRLKDAKIPCYTIAGSHDIGVDETIISLLESIGLVKNLNAARYYSSEGEYIKVDGEMIGDCFVCGVAGKRARIKEIYERIKPEKKGKFNIFMLHHIVSDISEKFADIQSSLLPRGFDYYAAGHWHSYADFKHDEGVIVYPGSTEYNDLYEMEKDENKYFVFVTTDPFNFEKIKLNIRKVVSKSIDCSGMDAQEVSAKAVSNIENADKNPILIVKLNGRLGKGTKSEIDRNEIIKDAETKGYLYTKIYLSSLENPEAPFVSGKSKTSAEIEREYLSKQEYSEDAIEVAQHLISLLGNKTHADESAAQVLSLIHISEPTRPY